MSYNAEPGRKPKVPFYVSTANGQVYPAQTGLPGFEDDNPVDWRPATADEIAAYENGVSLQPEPSGTVLLDSPAVQPSPTTLQLAEEDKSEEADPPQLPAGVVVGVNAPVAPAAPVAPSGPAFQIPPKP